MEVTFLSGVEAVLSFCAKKGDDFDGLAQPCAQGVQLLLLVCSLTALLQPSVLMGLTTTDASTGNDAALVFEMSRFANPLAAMTGHL